jgi:hypothetical protein
MACSCLFSIRFSENGFPFPGCLLVKSRISSGHRGIDLDRCKKLWL